MKFKFTKDKFLKEYEEYPRNIYYIKKTITLNIIYIYIYIYIYIRQHM